MKGVKHRDVYYSCSTHNKRVKIAEEALAPKRLLVHFCFTCFIVLSEEVMT